MNIHNQPWYQICFSIFCRLTLASQCCHRRCVTEKWWRGEDEKCNGNSVAEYHHLPDGWNISRLGSSWLMGSNKTANLCYPVLLGLIWNRYCRELQKWQVCQEHDRCCLRQKGHIAHYSWSLLDKAQTIRAERQPRWLVLAWWTAQPIFILEAPVDDDDVVSVFVVDDVVDVDEGGLDFAVSRAGTIFNLIFNNVWCGTCSTHQNHVTNKKPPIDQATVNLNAFWCMAGPLRVFEILVLEKS